MNVKTIAWGKGQIDFNDPVPPTGIIVSLEDGRVITITTTITGGEALTVYGPDAETLFEDALAGTPVSPWVARHSTHYLPVADARVASDESESEKRLAYGDR